MNRSLKISIVLAVLAFVWVISGSFSSTDSSTEQPSLESVATVATTEQSESTQQNTAPRFKVRVKHIQAVTMMDRIELQGEISASRDIDIKAETSGSITRLHAKKGDRLTVNQKIVTIAMNDRHAKLAQAQAELKVREADLESSKKLKQKKLLSQNQHQQNIANVAAAKAAVKQIQVEIQHTNIKAAFSGILNRLDVETGDYVERGDPIATLVDDQYITISSNIPQQHISKVALGQAVEAELLDGSKLAGEITYISSAADESTRTFRVEAKADNASQLTRFGQSARVNILIGELMAHKVSPSYLDLDNRGELRVKGIDTNQRVITKQVKIIRNENDGVWLAGIPETFTLITVGQGFVSQGDDVDAVEEDLEIKRAKASNDKTPSVTKATL